MTNAPTTTLTFDGITLDADRVCGNPDGYDRITASDPDTGQQLIEISWHRDTRWLGLRLHSDRLWSFEAVKQMHQLGIDALSWEEGEIGT
ncbi:hypothetical protein WG907_06760 [Sphingobium sp. AN558]|uniref:hypothetical protein n=1 Tax=Sphingobium sp. AN558 TaxID=3133442 RepID=UPI0030C01D43